MAKKKLFKEDGITEDFDAEAKELDDATAGGLVSDEGEAKADALGVDAGKADAGAAAPSDKPDSTTGGSSTDEAPAQEPSASSAPASAASATESAAPAPAEPEPFGELHGEVSELADHLESDAIDALKEAGNKLTPAVSKLHGIEEAFEKMGDELKARVQHAKTQLVNAMGALELIFKRGK